MAMDYILNILSHICLLSWASAKVTYVHEGSYVEILPSYVDGKTDFGYSMGYSSKKNMLVIGAPHHDLNGKVFSYSLENIFENKTVNSKEVDIDLEKLAGEYSRQPAPDQSFCLGSSITVASDYFLTCAPLWRAARYKANSVKQYDVYGACFIVTDEGSIRLKGAFEQISKLKETYEIDNMLKAVYGGSGWSTLIDEENNITLISLAPFNHISDMGYMNTTRAMDSMKFMNLYSSFPNLFKNIGKFVNGRFFKDKLITYALSSRMESMAGVIGFLRKPTRKKGKWEEMQDKSKVFIESSNSEIGSMFGFALHAVDVNSDEYSDLLVGAPAQGTSANHNAGALHIYLGGDKKKIKERRTILGNKPKGYFGMAIASKDLDGDNLSEIFVSAPFENSGVGAVYILNGKEIKDFIENSNPNTNISLSDLKLTQRIQNTKYMSFGYSLQPLSDLDDNGCSEIAIGAPNSGKVLVYRSMPTMFVNLTAEIDRDYVRQTDQNCSIHVKINIIYPTKPETISASLIVTMKAVGNSVSIDGTGSFVLNLNRSQSLYEADVLVKFGNEEPGSHTIIFNADVESTFDAYLKNDEFDKSRIGVSPHSSMEDLVKINRRCRNEDCVPILSSTIEWSDGENSYTLGSSTNETITVMVLNKGNETFDSCMKILIEGSKVVYINADQNPAGWYTYWLPKPFERHTSHTLKIPLDMSTQSNLDKELRVTIYLYNICDRGNFTVYEKEVPYKMSTNMVAVESFSTERNISDYEISNPQVKFITDDHVYTVINKGTVTWNTVHAVINIKKQEYINSYRISKLESIKCLKTEEVEKFSFSCQFNLERLQYIKFVVTLELDKDTFKRNLQDNQLNILSSFEYLQSNEYKIVKETTTTFYYKIDASLGQHKVLIIVGAVLLSVLIFLIITFILYKRGFFERSKKNKYLKQEILKRSIKRPNPVLTVASKEGPENVHSNATSSIQENNDQNRSNEEHETMDGHEKTPSNETNEMPASIDGHKSC